MQKFRVRAKEQLNESKKWRNVSVLGASGNVGRSIVNQLKTRDDVQRIVLLGRRELVEFKGNNKIEQYVVSMDKLYEESLPLLKDIDVVFITMGVGQPKKVSVEELERIDVTLPTEFCRAAKENEVRHVSILTSTGADVKLVPGKQTYAGSNTYLHFKGKVEENIAKMGFESFRAIRPATLLGNTNTPGFFEWLAPKFDWALPKRFNSIHIDHLARAMINCADETLQENEPAPVLILEGETLFDFID